MFIRLVPLLIFVPLLGVVAAGCAKRTAIPATVSAAPGAGTLQGTGTPKGAITPRGSGTMQAARMPRGSGTMQAAATPQGTGAMPTPRILQETGTTRDAGAAFKPGVPLAAAPVTSAPAATPGAPRPTPEEFTPTGVLRDIHFDFDRYDIRPRDAKILDGHSEWLRGNRRSLILIEGHADERGTNEYNLALGERRAKAAMDYLIARGVAADQVLLITYGEERPLCIEENDACWARNRRAHFLVKRQ